MHIDIELSRGMINETYQYINNTFKVSLTMTSKILVKTLYIYIYIYIYY